MPLRQTLLDFKNSSSPVPTIEQATQPKARPSLSRMDSSMSSNLDTDTIVVDLSEPRFQLPTPSESATDVSSVSSQVVSMKEVPKGRGKRVSRRLTKRQSEDCLVDMAEDEKETSRTVSGETLVNSASVSQNSLVQNGIALLNLPWSMSQVFDKGSKAALVQQMEHEASEDSEALDTITMNVEEDQERLEKAAVKKAKMEENRKQREERWKAAEDKATRRSSRATMLEKAGEFVSDLAANVLGKRKDRLGELRGGTRPNSAIEPRAGEMSFNGPDSKKRRLSADDIPSTSATRKSFSGRREKRWLVSGLYAGQARTFDSRLTESKNKRKTTEVSLPTKENNVIPLPMFAGERLLKQGRDFKLPWDVFSPLPHGQPKPDEWRKTNKNVFVGDAAQEWRTSKFVEHSTCMCRPETGCDHNCMNRFMYYECDDRNCNISEDTCANRSFEGLRQRSKRGGKYNVGVEVIKTVDRGYGVRSNRTFDPNQIIVEYTGEIITQEECESRMRTIYKDNECYYLMLFDQNMIIDATRGSIARFVNHSCEPNCRMEKWTVGGKPRMALFAGEGGIMTGEELTYDYNFDPYSQKNVQECRCGAKNCRGVLGPKSKEEKRKSPEQDKAPEKESKAKGVKRKMAEVLEESSSRLNKKRKVDSAQPAKPKVYGSGSLSVSQKARRSATSLKLSKAKLVKKNMISARKTSLVRHAATELARRPSKLKRIIASARGKKAISGSTVSKGQSKRVISSSSASEALIIKDPTTSIRTTTATATLSRSGSLKAKAETLKRNVVRTVKGGQHGRERSIRPVMGEVLE